MNWNKILYKMGLLTPTESPALDNIAHRYTKPEAPVEKEEKPEKKEKPPRIPKKRWYNKKCIVTNKVRYQSRKAADQACTEVKKRGKARYLRSYKCEFCSRWHVTHGKSNL